jgi:membrane protein
MFPRRFPLLHGLSWIQVRDLFRFASRRLDEEHLPQVASSLTFTTVLALVPLLTIALAIFTAFPLFTTFRTSLDAYFIQSLMPKLIANTILGYLNQFAAKSTGLSAIGAVALVITAVAMMSTIDRVFNRIWGVRVARPVVQRVLVYWAIVTLGPLLIGVSISVTSYLFTATNGAVLKIPLIGAIFYTVLSVVLTTGAFTLLYVVVPNRAIDWRDAIWGGLLAGVALELAKRLFAVYIVKFPTYTMVYGSVAAVPIFLIWIYLFWMITLSGALVAAAVPVIKYERWQHVARPGSAFIDAMAILRVLYHARIEGASAVVDRTVIRSCTRIGFDESELLLQQMLAAGWVARISQDASRRTKHTSENRDRWTLLSNPDQLRLVDVYRLFVFDPVANIALANEIKSVIDRGLDRPLSACFDVEAHDGHLLASAATLRMSITR